MMPYEDIAARFYRHKNTIGNWIKTLKSKGLINVSIARYAKSKEKHFTIQNGAYIQPSQVLLTSLGWPKEMDKTEDTNKPIFNDTPKEPSQKTEFDKPNHKNCVFEKPKNVVTIYKYIDSKSFINTISHAYKGKDVDFDRNLAKFKRIERFFMCDIKEEVHIDIKKLIVGTFGQLIFKHKVELSNPTQIAAEYLFAFLNAEHFFPNVEDIKHRNNILAKLIRDRRWTTPHGFFKHFWMKDAFKTPLQREEESLRRKKEEIDDSKLATDIIEEALKTSPPQSQELRDVEKQMLEVSERIEEITALLYNTNQPCEISSYREQIQEQKDKLEVLWQLQSSIEQEMGVWDQSLHACA